MGYWKWMWSGIKKIPKTPIYLRELFSYPLVELMLGSFGVFVLFLILGGYLFQNFRDLLFVVAFIAWGLVITHAIYRELEEDC